MKYAPFFFILTLITSCSSLQNGSTDIRLVEIQNISLGTSSKDLVSKFGKPTHIFESDDSGNQIYNYHTVSHVIPRASFIIDPKSQTIIEKSWWPTDKDSENNLLAIKRQFPNAHFESQIKYGENPHYIEKTVVYTDKTSNFELIGASNGKIEVVSWFDPTSRSIASHSQKQKTVWAP